MSDNISIMPSIAISSSGLDAETRRMEVIANNIANANTTSDANGKVFRRKQVVFAEKLSDKIENAGGKRMSEGVEVSDTVEDSRDLKKVYRPGHPSADKDGFVSMPNVNPVEEMVDMMSSVRAYEANLAAIRAARKMATQALGISK
jgi:flagellar basal-body rod protein FlgC